MRRFVVREFVDVAKLTPARRRKALERMKPAAVERKMTELVAAIGAPTVTLPLLPRPSLEGNEIGAAEVAIIDAFPALVGCRVFL